MKNHPIMYLLRDTECWQHRSRAYPIKIPYPFDSELSIGASYTAERFSVAEEKIRNSFSQRGQSVALMNPLYQFDGKAETTITIDILLNSEAQNEATLEKQLVPAWFKDMQKLLMAHNNRMKEIFASGGDLSMQTKGTVHVSNDKTLRDIEETIRRHFGDAKKLAEIVKMIQEGNIAGTEILQWIGKNESIIDILIDVSSRPETSVTQCNLILRQLIPCVSNFNKKQFRAIRTSLEKLLLRAVPNVRNKALCILSELPERELQSMPQETQYFIENISNTCQLNCSYPAKEIVKKIKTLKA